MTRGVMKQQAKAKNQKKIDAAKKNQSHDQKGACLKSLTLKCSICMTQFVDLKSYKCHFENKHPKSPLPAELLAEEE